MALHYTCGTLNRRQAVAEPTDTAGNPVAPTINGIDYLEVSADQKSLRVHFIHPLPGEANAVPPAPAPVLDVENIRIEGGVRIPHVRVVSVQANARTLRVDVSEPGDFSTYQLRLVTSVAEGRVPPGFDPQLGLVDFSFKVDCPSDFDCESAPACPTPTLTQPELNYLAKDYASFRRLIYDRLSVIMPAWRERNPADLQVALVELIAHVGDHLSYYQDAVATEAYLGTARQRRSVRRHARLLDYRMHDGCNARVWVCFEVTSGGGADGALLDANRLLLTGETRAGAAVPVADLPAAMAEAPMVFSTLHAIELRSARNGIGFYTWSDSDCCLPRGATRATLRRDAALTLAVGDVLVLEEIISPETGLAADADPANRHAVRLTSVVPDTDPLTGSLIYEIGWHAEDALPFALRVSALVTPGGGAPQLVDATVARANVVLAEHGRLLEQQELVPAAAPAGENFRPRLAHAGITFREDYEHAVAIDQAATRVLRQDPRAALPDVRLSEGGEEWRARRDLLGSDRFAAEFVVETETDGSAHLRFGDDVLGKEPATGTVFAAAYRTGSGSTGNVGPEAIRRVVTDFPDFQRVWNPLPAVGGTDAESMEEVRQFAPQAFRVQERAVTEADWAEVARRHPEVQKAAATFRWTGSWYTVFVTLDRKGGRPVDAAFETELREHLEKYRIAGYDLEVDGPVFVPLEITLNVCVQPGYFRPDVEAGLLTVLGPLDQPDGRRGFFHPDNFTFGQTLFVSQLIEVAMDVDGVASVSVQKFQRWHATPAGELTQGYIAPQRLEILRCDNDPNFPENGKLQLNLQGGV